MKLAPVSLNNRYSSFAAPQNKTGNALLSIAEIKERIPDLRADFDNAFGAGVFDNTYFLSFNEKPSMQDQDFNKSAHFALMAYFMQASLKRPIQGRRQLIRTFQEEAVKPRSGQTGGFDVNTLAMIRDLHETIRQALGSDNESPAGQGHSLEAA